MHKFEHNYNLHVLIKLSLFKKPVSILKHRLAHALRKIKHSVHGLDTNKTQDKFY